MRNNLEEEIKSLLAAGEKIAAIKRYREETGANLAASKTAVELLETGGSWADAPPSPDQQLINEIVYQLSRGEKIEAVKLYRDKLRVGLKEAKDAVEAIGEENGIPKSSGDGCFGIIILIAAIPILALLHQIV